MVPIIAFVGLITIMICVLVAPSAVNDAMRWRIPAEARPSPPRHPHFPVILIFLLGIGLFYEIGREWTPKYSLEFNAWQHYVAIFSAICLAALGVVACYWPFLFMSAFIRKLRGVSRSGVDARSIEIIEVAAKLFGVVFLLASSWIVHLIGSAT